MRRTRARTWSAECEGIEHSSKPRDSPISISRLREVLAEAKHSRTKIKSHSTFNLLKMCDKEPWIHHMASYVQDLISNSSICATRLISCVHTLIVNGVTTAPNLTRLQTTERSQSATSTTKTPKRDSRPKLNSAEAWMACHRFHKRTAS